MDLQDVRNGNFDMKERILEITNASAFTVDPSSYEIFFSSPLMQTIGKAQLDGSEMVDERPSDSRHENLTNLERYGGLFHWTEETEDKGPCSLNGMITEADSLLFESLKKEVIEVTEYGGFFCVHGYGGLDILHPSAQPFPVPLVAPQGLQVLFDVTSAQLSWQPVKRLESKGNMLLSFLSDLFLCTGCLRKAPFGTLLQIEANLASITQNEIVIGQCDIL